MRRREFIVAVIGGSLAVASSQAQQPGKLYWIGVLSADTVIINLQTAKALGIEIPVTLLARADEVIE